MRQNSRLHEGSPVHGGSQNRASEEEEIEEEDELLSIEDATAYLYSIKVKHCVSDNAFKHLWNGFKKILPILQFHPPESLPSADTVKRQAMRDIPQMRLQVAHKNLETGENVFEHDLEKFPKKKYENREAWEPLYEVWRADIEEVCNFHSLLHQSNTLTCNEVILNIDGVPIGHTGRSQIIVSLTYSQECKNVYQIVNAIPHAAEGKKMLSIHFLFQSLCDDLTRLNLTVRYICADAPMRALLRNQKSHSGKKACDYCYGSAAHDRRPIWGVRTLNQEPRTMSRLLQDYEDHDENGTPLEVFGYNGKSALLDLLPGFDIVENVPVDPMHLLYLGIARALFELLFHVGQNRATNMKRPRATTKGLDMKLPRLQTPTEIVRRPRAIDFKNYKASEWRNLVLYYFPIVLEELPEGLPRQMWLEFSFLARAYSLDEESYNSLQVDLKELALKWYRNFHHLFGKTNMRYNLHLISHLERIRKHGPFPEISAFDFESSFAVSTRVQKCGTTSVGLQGMRHTYIRPREGHACKKKIIYRKKRTPRSNDTLVYTCNGIYEIVEPLEAFNLLVKKVITTTYFPPVRRSQLDLASIGVYKFLYTENKTETITRIAVHGKVIAVPVEDGTVLLTATKAMLREGD